MNTKELNEKLEKIKLLAMDVDGTMTDASMFYSAEGEALKRFSTRDGMGITLLHKAGIATAIITSENSEIARKRAEKLKIEHIIIDCRNKTGALNELAQKIGGTLENIAYIGDDVNDIKALKLAGVSACPIDAAGSVLSLVDYVSQFNGGRGAVRDFAEKILISQNKPIDLEENW